MMYWLPVLVAFILPHVCLIVGSTGTCTRQNTILWYNKWLEYTRVSGKPLQQRWPRVDQLHSTSPASHNFYTLTPVQLGCEVRGIDLKQHVSDEVIVAIRADVNKHKILIFKDQGVVPADRHVEMADWFGGPHSTFDPQPLSPHRHILRISNDHTQGLTNVGRSGWHIDGSHQALPFAYALYHMASVPSHGATVFIPLTDLLGQLPREQLIKWERLSMVSGLPGATTHPLLYSHPITNNKVMCFHLGSIRAYIWDHKTPRERVTKDRETMDIHQEIHHLFNTNKDLQYKHEWRVGDFLIVDNLSVAHEAAPESQYPRSQVGLRVLHRVTTVGHPTPPRKTYTPPT